MSYPRVKEYFEGLGLENLITVHETPCDTVAHAAENIGCEEAQIAKTMSFLIDDEPIVIVCTGDVKIANPKYKATFHKKAKMIPFDMVTEITGHEPGGVCPFALKEGVKVYLDESLRRFEDVHAAGGRPDVTVHITVEKLEELCRAQWVDVCG